MKLAKRIEQFPEYIHSRLNKKVADVEEITGRKVLNFGQGTPDFRPSKKYVDKYCEFVIQESSHLYPGYGPIPEFTYGLTEWYKTRFDVLLSPDELYPLLGGKDGISHLPLALFDTGDEVLIPDPGYPAFSEPAIMLGVKPIYYPLTEKNSFKLDFAELKKKINKRTKAIWVNFPSNPTGQVATLEDLKKITTFAKKHDLIILYDNAYAEIAFGKKRAPSILQVEGAIDRAIEIGSFSKMASFAGFRMGWIVGNKKIIAGLAKIKSQMDSGLSLPLQRLGAYVFLHPDSSWQEKMIASYQTRRDSIAEKLRLLGMEFTLPEGGLYIWAKIPKGEKNSWDFCMNLLQDKQILFTPGTAFGKNGEGYVRVSYCVNIDKIDEYF